MSLFKTEVRDTSTPLFRLEQEYLNTAKQDLHLQSNDNNKGYQLPCPWCGSSRGFLFVGRHGGLIFKCHAAGCETVASVSRVLGSVSRKLQNEFNEEKVARRIK